MAEIKTREIAARIVDQFEDVLELADITVPSPEDGEKDPENDAALYGSVYADLLDSVEQELIDTLTGFDCNKDKIIPYIF